MMRLPQKAKCELPRSATLIYSAEAGIQGTVWPYNAPEGDGGSVFKYLIYVWYGIWETRHINYLSTRMGEGVDTFAKFHQDPQHLVLRDDMGVYRKLLETFQQNQNQ